MKLCFGWIVLFSLICFNSTAIANSKNEPDWYGGYDVKWYKIDIHCSDTIAYIWGNTTILIETTDKFTDTLYFELATNNLLDSLLIKGVSYTFIRKENLVLVPLGTKYKPNSLLQVIIYHRGGSNGSLFFSSFTNKIDAEWNIPVTWTLSEPFGAKSWFPCKQSLTDKADSAEIRITVPGNLKAGSNGKLQAVEKKDSGQVQFIWKTKYPIAYYLLSFCVAEYQEYSFYVPIDKTDSVFVQNYIYNRKGFFEKNKKSIDATGDFLKLFSELYGTYPFKDEKYGHCVAPMGGGMEHQTMTTLSGFGYDLVSHELSHQWFGNMVTCLSWQDIWINEGFASYSEYLAIEFLKSKALADVWMENAHDYVFYSKEGSVFLTKDEAENENRIFSYSLTYKKGASIVHMLRKEIANDSLFFSILRDFISTYAFKNASVKDFVELLNKKAGINYNWFFDQWYYGKGFPECHFFWKETKDSVSILAMNYSSAKDGRIFKFKYNVKISGGNSDTIFTTVQENQQKTITLPIRKKVDLIDINTENETLMRTIGINKVPDLPTNDDFFSIENFTFDEKLTIQFKNKPDKSGTLLLTNLSREPILNRTFKKQKSVILDTQWFERGYYLLYVYYKNDKFVRIIYKDRRT